MTPNQTLSLVAGRNAITEDIEALNSHKWSRVSNSTRFIKSYGQRIYKCEKCDAKIFMSNFGSIATIYLFIPTKNGGSFSFQLKINDFKSCDEVIMSTVLK